MPYGCVGELGKFDCKSLTQSRTSGKPASGSSRHEEPYSPQTDSNSWSGDRFEIGKRSIDRLIRWVDRSVEALVAWLVARFGFGIGIGSLLNHLAHRERPIAIAREMCDSVRVPSARGIHQCVCLRWARLGSAQNFPHSCSVFD